MDKLWSSGKVRKMIQNKVGVISQYDGKEVFFELSDLQDEITVDEEAETRLVGKEVHYLTEKTELGLQARKITLLKK